MTLQDALRSGKVLLLDGAMGTQLMARGARGSNELWGIEHPDDLRAIHRGYVEAGASAIIADTFGGSRPKLDRMGLAARLVELNRRPVEIAREVARNGSDSVWVLGDVGPTGQFVEPYGDFSRAQMTDVFREQIAVLAEAGVDGIIIETMMDPAEAECAVVAAKSVAPHLPVLASMTFERNPRGFHTVMGATPEDAINRLASAGADVVGANCGGIAPKDYVDLLRTMHVVGKVPLLAEPNAGLPQIGPDGATVYRETLEAFARIAGPLRENGASVIGGCCGTTPEHIRAIATALRGTTVHRG